MFAPVVPATISPRTVISQETKCVHIEANVTVLRLFHCHSVLPLSHFDKKKWFDIFILDLVILHGVPKVPILSWFQTPFRRIKIEEIFF